MLAIESPLCVPNFLTDKYGAMPYSPVTLSPASIAATLKLPENPSNESEPKEDKTIGKHLGVADILRLYFDDYRKNNAVTPRQYKVVYDILNCRTGSFGYSISACDNCGHTEVFLNSCRNSHCPNCQGKKRIEWVDSRLNDLLPVPYYHGVFTLPNGIFPFCLYNQQVVYDLLMSSAAKTVEAFGYDSKWLGGKTGFFMVLHTWGQQLCVHPHVHCVIPAIGYNKDSCELVRSKYEKNDFLFPGVDYPKCLEASSLLD